ncbi:hypothetical protein SH501x_000505 [Pirellulaceae bacterium SH501]
MAASIFADQSAGKLVQTRFDFDAPSMELPRMRAPVAESGVEFSRTGQHNAVPTRVRRGECRHVGGALVSVLGKYGLTVDALLDEIERQKALQNASGVLVQ